MPISDRTLEFLMENRLRDSRPWFLEHKAEYQQYVIQPMRDLVEQLAPTMLKIDPLLVVEPKVDKTISRIYRDIRFSKDKSLYRDVMWCVFLRDKKQYADMPAFVMEYSPNGFRYGCGYYQAPPKVMAAMRELILANSKGFQKARKAYEGQTLFQMEGETYKRSKYPAQPEAVQNWLNRRNIAFMHNSQDIALLCSDGLADVLAQGFQQLMPMYDFLCQAEQHARETAD